MDNKDKIFLLIYIYFVPFLYTCSFYCPLLLYIKIILNFYLEKNNSNNNKHIVVVSVLWWKWSYVSRDVMLRMRTLTNVKVLEQQADGGNHWFHMERNI